MIKYEFEYETVSLNKLERKLGKLKSDAPKALKNAINQTARKARTDLKNQTRAVYSIKAGKVSSAEKLYTASVANLEAIIRVKGEAPSITEYRATTPKSGAKAGQKKGSLKQLVTSAGKAWGSDGLIWQRKTNDRLPVKVIHGSSVPVLMRPDGQVFNKVEPTINKNLMDYVNKQVEKILTSA